MITFLKTTARFLQKWMFFPHKCFSRYKTCVICYSTEWDPALELPLGSYSKLISVLFLINLILIFEYQKDYILTCHLHTNFAFRAFDKA